MTDKYIIKSSKPEYEIPNISVPSFLIKKFEELNEETILIVSIYIFSILSGSFICHFFNFFYKHI